MLDSSPLPLPSQAALRKVMVAVAIALALSSGLYDYTSCSNKVSTKATGIDNPLTAYTALLPRTGSKSIAPRRSRRRPKR